MPGFTKFPGGGGWSLGPSPSPLGVFHTSKPLPGRGVLPLVMPRVILRLKAALLLVIPDRTGNVCTVFWLECRNPAYRILLLVPFTLNCVRSLSNLILSICPPHRPLQRLANFKENVINIKYTVKLTFYLHLVVLILIS